MTKWGFRHIAPWAGRGSFAVLDQALFAGSHFALNVALARWLLPSDYGAFATAYSLFLLVGACHQAMVVEPMMVLGAGRFARSLRGYLHRLALLHLPTAGAFAIATLVAFTCWKASPNNALTGAALGLAVGGIFMLVMNLLRRGLFVQLRPAWSVLGGTIYAVALLGVAWTLQQKGVLSPMTAFLAMGGASVLTSIVMVPMIGRGAGPGYDPPPWRAIILDHWRYGRWALLTVIPIWISGNIYYVLLPWFVGLEGAGAFRAILNLSMPVLHTFMGLSMILLPALAKRHAEQGGASLGPPLRRLLGIFALGSIGYLALLVPLGERIVDVLYGGQYAELGLLSYWLVGLIPMAAALVSVFATGLRAMERPDLVLKGHAAAAILVLLGSFMLLPSMEVVGALMVMLVGTAGGGFVMWRTHTVTVRSPAP